MPFPPSQINDPFDASISLNSFGTPPVPSSSGLGTRQSRIKNERPGFSARNLMRWLVPEGPIVEMYMNPQRVDYNYTKDIPAETRTKGGYILQYWGQQLTTLTLSGTTGTAGIEGINVLYDVYRNEQLAFDPYALYLAAEHDKNAFSDDIFGFDAALEAGGGLLGDLLGAGSPGPKKATQAPSLAALAFTVELYWSGEVYRGYFTKFTVSESVDKLGLFDYTIDFKVTQKRGYRQNFLAWHRSATSGPSASDPITGNPYSFGALVVGEQALPRRAAVATTQSLLGDVEDLFNSTWDF